MKIILFVLAALVAGVALIFFNSDLWERYKKAQANRPAPPRPSPITQDLKDIFKPLI